MILISGMAVDNRKKEKVLRDQIESQAIKIGQLEEELNKKYIEIQKLILKIHAMGGRVKK